MLNRSWKSWARPGGRGCRKSFQHFRGTAFHGDNPIPSRYLRTTLPNILGWKCSVSPLSAIGRRKSFRLKALASSVFRSPPGVCLWSPHQTSQALLTTDRFVLPQMFGKPSWMPCQVSFQIATLRIRVAVEPHLTSTWPCCRARCSLCTFTEVWCSIQFLKALIWTTGRRDGFGKFRLLGNSLLFHRYQPWQVKKVEPTRLLSLLLSPQSGSKGLICWILWGDIRIYKRVSFSIPKDQIQKTWRHMKTEPKVFEEYSLLTVYLSTVCLFCLFEDNLPGPKPRIQWSLLLRPYVADFDLCRWTDPWWMDDANW